MRMVLGNNNSNTVVGGAAVTGNSFASNTPLRQHFRSVVGNEQIVGRSFVGSGSGSANGNGNVHSNNGGVMIEGRSDI